MHVEVEEEEFGGLSGEELESTLGVLHTPDAQHPHQEVETVHQEGPKDRSLERGGGGGGRGGYKVVGGRVC